MGQVFLIYFVGFCSDKECILLYKISQKFPTYLVGFFRFNLKCILSYKISQKNFYKYRSDIIYCKLAQKRDVTR